MSKWIAKVVVCQFMIGLLVGAAPGAQADPLDTLPSGLLWRNDGDGGRTWQIQIDDDPTGPITHTSTYAFLPQGVKDALAPDVQDLGTYVHPWGSSPTLTTYGVYTVTGAMGLERHPLLVVENEPPGNLGAILQTKLMEAIGPLVQNQRPYLLNYLLPTTLLLEDPGYGHPSTFPADPASYRDHPTLYIWTSHKKAGSSEVWQGWYLERTGSSGSSGAAAFAERRTEIGPALRIGSTTDHLAALYVEEDNRRVASATETHMEQTITVGATRDAIDVPLVTVRASDDRHDDEGEIVSYPDHQRTGYAIGTRGPGGQFIPLIGTYTESESEWTADGIPNTRTTSVGVFVNGNYQPVAGFRYEGERWPMDLWALLWALSGGPGTDFSGDFEITAGYFVLGQYKPVASVRYDDAFDEAHHTYQMMIRVGVYANGYAGPYQALLGVTYDGTLPLVFAALATESEWIMSAGTFILDDYLPLVGMTARTWRDDQTFAQHERYEIGVFAGDYDAFVPLLFATWDAHMRSTAWVLTAQNNFGMLGRDVDVAVGANAVGKLAGVEYRSETPSGYTYKGMATAGVFVGGTFVPVAGVAHCSPEAGVPGMYPDNRPHVLIGVYVEGTFTPVARLRLANQPGNIGVDLTPTPTC